VTRLPDGRVLKGSRSAQRKNARFWTQVAEDTNELLDHVHLPSTEEGTGNTQEGTAAKSTPKKRQRATHSASHGRKAATRSKPRVTGSRSSRRRFK
jgi:hypothetical protein